MLNFIIKLISYDEKDGWGGIVPDIKELWKSRKPDLDDIKKDIEGFSDDVKDVLNDLGETSSTMPDFFETFTPDEYIQSATESLDLTEDQTEAFSDLASKMKSGEVTINSTDDAMVAYATSLRTVNTTTKMTTTATKAMSAAMKVASKVGWMIVVSLVAEGIGRLVESVSDAIVTSEEFVDKQNDLIDKAKEQIEAYEDEISTLEQLKESLLDAKGDKEKLASISNDLNSTIGETTGLLDGEAGAWDVANQKIQDRIDRLKELSELELQNKINESKKLFNERKISNNNGVDVTLDEVRKQTFSTYGSSNITSRYNSKVSSDQKSLNGLLSYIRDELKMTEEEYNSFREGLITQVDNYDVGTVHDWIVDMFPNANLDSGKIYEKLSHDSNFGRMISAEEFNDYINGQVETVKEIFGDYFSNHQELFSVDEIYSVLDNLVAKGYSLETIENSLEPLLNNDSLTKLVDDFYVSLKDDSVESEPILEQISEYINRYKNIFPEYTEILDLFYKQLFENIPTSSDVTIKDIPLPSFESVFNSSDFSEQKEELLELAKAGELTSETLSSTEEYVTLLKQTGLSAESAKDKIYNLLSAQERLAGAHNGLDDLSNSYKEFKDLGFVTAQTLEELPDVFKSLEGYDLFAKIVGNPESGVKAIQNAFNDIVKEYLIFIQTLNVNDLISDDFETQQRAINTYIANLKQMGVTNAEEVVNQTIESLKQQQTLLDNAATEYVDYLRGKNGVDLQYIESTASYNSQFINSLGEGYETNYNNWLNLLKDKELAYQRFTKSLDGDGDGEFIYDPNKNIIDNLIANNKEVTFYSIVEAETAKAEYDRISKKYEDLRDSLTFNPTFEGDFLPDWNGLDSGSGSNTPSDTYFDWIETKLDKLNDQLKETKEKAEDSLNGWKIRADAFTEAENQIESLIATQEEAKARYLEEANKSGLPDEYKSFVQDGVIDIDKLSNDNPLKEQIESYQKWYDKVKECDEAIDELNADLKQLYRDKREFRWEVFDYLEDSISRIIGEADYLVELLSSEDLFDDNGNFTKYADATLGLHVSNLQSYKQQALDYKEEMESLENDLANGGGQVLDKYNERVDAHRDAINAIQKEKQAILDLVEEGYNAQLEALNKLINKKKEALSEEKALYDYQQSIAEKTSNISSLQKQYDTYKNSTSEEDIAKAQQLKVKLEEAKADLEQTEYEKMISDQEQMLDQLSSDYEQWIEQRLENSDTLLQQIIDNLSADGSINATLQEIAKKNGTFVSDELTSSISDGANSSINSYLDEIIKLLGGDDSFFGNAGSKIKGYASGTKRSGKEWAWTQEKGVEFIRTKDGALLTPLNNSMVYNNESSKRLWEFSQNPSAFLEKMGMNNIIQPIFNIPKLLNIERPLNQTPINNITHMEVVLPSVTNYDDFMNRIQNDKRFDNIVTASMNSKMTGSNSLSKLRF